MQSVKPIRTRAYKEAFMGAIFKEQTSMKVRNRVSGFRLRFQAVDSIYPSLKEHILKKSA